MYKPLPESLTIKTSKVNGLGLFAKEAIPQATNLGMTHIKIGDYILRTPLGGFINHSNNPNCVKVELLMSNHDNPNIKFDYKKWNLVTIKDIKPEEELTLKYTFYNI
jgi:SET domain-containing protein